MTISQTLLLLGNPRIGKSAFLNAVLAKAGYKGKANFESGLSFGGGLTQVLQQFEYKGVRYADTPGLADPTIAEKAAKEIEMGLKLGGSFTIVFFVKQINGMIVCEDMTTITSVLNSIDVPITYGVVVNQVSENVMKALQIPQNKLKAESQIQMAVKKTSKEHNQPEIWFEGSDGSEPGEWVPSEGLFNFVETLPQTIIPAEKVSEVKQANKAEAQDMQNYLDAMTNVFQLQLTEMKNQNRVLMDQMQQQNANFEKEREIMKQMIQNMPKPSAGMSRSDMEAMMKKNVPEPQGGCFPGDAIVQTLSGNVKLCNVQLGDYIRVSANDSKFERVIGWYDFFPAASRGFTVLAFADGSKASLTPNHMLFASVSQNVDSLVAHQAANVKPGMFVASVNSAVPIQVTSVTEETRLGIFSPVVFGDKVVVDGILMSAYAKPSAFVDVEISDVWVHTLCHAGSLPIRMSLSVSTSTEKQSSSLVSWMLPAIKSIVGGSVKGATSLVA